MSVTYRTIIQRMINELEEAKKNDHNELAIKKHVSHVQLLGELILGEELKDETMSDEEMKKMIGKTYQDKQRKNESKSSYTESKGDSIFDF